MSRVVHDCVFFSRNDETDVRAGLRGKRTNSALDFVSSRELLWRLRFNVGRPNIRYAFCLRLSSPRTSRSQYPGLHRDLLRLQHMRRIKVALIRRVFLLKTSACLHFVDFIADYLESRTCYTATPRQQANEAGHFHLGVTIIIRR